MQYAPINPADVYTVRTGGVYGEEQVKSPFYAGHDGIGFVSKVVTSPSPHIEIVSLSTVTSTDLANILKMVCVITNACVLSCIFPCTSMRRHEWQVHCKQASIPCGVLLQMASAKHCLPALQVGDGVKSLAEGDWVVPAATHVGTWRNLAVWKEADLLKVTKELMPLEHAAMLRELCLAYRLLEDHGNLKMSYSPSAPGSIGCISRQHC